MKLASFLPDVASTDAKLALSNTMLNKLYENGFASFVKGRYGGGSDSAVNFYGIEQLYFDWLRTAYAYRRMFIQDLYLLAFDSTEIRTPLLHLKNEVFRKGFDQWKPAFMFKCEYCGQEYQEKIVRCACGSESLREPDVSQFKEFDKVKLTCNIWGQSLEEVLRTTHDDVNIVDDLYIFLNKQYRIFNNQLYEKVVEVRRLHPALIEMDLDKNGLPENSHWVCPFHRDKIFTEETYCKECKINALPAMYVYNHRGRRVYLFKDELLHNSKFSPSETYGYSPLLTIMQKVLTVSGMDRFLYRYFFERKAPTGMILTYTDDPQSLEVERQRVEAKMMEDPTYMPWVAVSQKTGRGRTDFVRLFHTLHEMDYLPVRNEIRDRIASIYGVPQIYMNVMEGVGGISGQTQQLKVFSNVIASDQRMFNEKIFPKLLKSFGITDWRIELRPPEEKVEGQILTLAQQKVGVAAQMHQLGFTVELKPESKDIETLDFNFSGEAVPMQQPGAMGGLGGLLGAPQAPAAGGLDMAGAVEGGDQQTPQLPEVGQMEQDQYRPPHLEDQAHEFTRALPQENDAYAKIESSSTERPNYEDQVFR